MIPVPLALTRISYQEGLRGRMHPRTRMRPWWSDQRKLARESQRQRDKAWRRWQEMAKRAERVILRGIQAMCSK